MTDTTTGAKKTKKNIFYLYFFIHIKQLP